MLEANAALDPHPRGCATAVLRSSLSFVSETGWAMINPDKYCCFYCAITSVKSSSQEYKQLEASALQVTLKGYLVIEAVLSVLATSFSASPGFTSCLFRLFLHTSIRCTCGGTKTHYKREKRIVVFTCWSIFWVFEMEQRIYYRSREERPNSVGRNVLTEEMKLLSSAFEMCG